jgi:hypothetical protein
MEVKDRVLNITTSVNPSNISYDYTFTNKILKSLSRSDFSVLFVNKVDDPYSESRISINNIYEEYQVDKVEYGSMYVENVTHESNYNLLGFYEDESTRVFLVTCSSSAVINRIITVYDKVTMSAKHFGYLSTAEEVEANSITYLQYVNNTVYIIPSNMAYGVTYIPLVEDVIKIIYLSSTFKVYTCTAAKANTGVSAGNAVPGGMLYNNSIYVLPDSSTFTPFKIDCTTKAVTQVTLDTSLSSKKIIYISQIGENNDFGYKNQMCFLSIDGDLYTIDLGDLTVSVVSTT